MIAVEATMVAESAGLRVRIDGAGNVLTCRLDGDAVRSLAALRSSGAHLAALRSIIPLLIRAGLRLDFVAGRLTLGAAGTGVRQNSLGRLPRFAERTNRDLMRVLITGATGYIGGRLVPALVGAGHSVRCMARDPARLRDASRGSKSFVAMSSTKTRCAMR